MCGEQAHLMVSLLLESFFLRKEERGVVGFSYNTKLKSIACENQVSDFTLVSLPGE